MIETSFAGHKSHVTAFFKEHCRVVHLEVLDPKPTLTGVSGKVAAPDDLERRAASFTVAPPPPPDSVLRLSGGLIGAVEEDLAT
jgi:hypothetical protein